MTLSRLPHKHPEFSHFNIILNKPQNVLVFSRITHSYSMSRPVAFLYNKVISLREREQIIPIFLNKFALSFCWSCCVCGGVVAGPPAASAGRVSTTTTYQQGTRTTFYTEFIPQQCHFKTNNN